MKLFITDLDGTLLDKVDHVSAYTMKYLHELKQHGYEIVIASGRQYPIIQTMGLNELEPYVISSNGSIVYDPQGNIIYEQPLSTEQVKQILDVCDELSLLYFVYTKDKMYVKSPKNLIHQLYEMAKEHTKSEAEMLDFMEMFAADVMKLPFFDEAAIKRIDTNEETVYKIEANATHQDIFKVLEKQLGDSYSIAASWATNREITALSVNKGVAMEKLCEYLSISIADCISIGDNRNDIEMLEKAGYSIAMGNASDEIKAICDMTTCDCNDHGVAKAVKQLLQKDK